MHDNSHSEGNGRGTKTNLGRNHKGRSVREDGGSHGMINRKTTRPTAILLVVSIILLTSAAINGTMTMYTSTPKDVTNSPDGEGVGNVLYDRVDSTNFGESLFNLASAQGQGQQNTAVEYFSREVSNLTLSILNTYNTPAKHNGTIDLTPYLLPGWTLYQTEITTINLTAAPERVSIGGDNGAKYEFVIEEYSDPYRYIGLSQGFYSKPFYGQLLNYSFLYSTSGYNPLIRGDAYSAILSSYSVSNTNLSSYIPLVSTGGLMTWRTVNTPDTILNPETEYYAVINGSELYKGGTPAEFPKIYWAYLESTGAYDTAQYDTKFDAWASNLAWEAAMNYTYVPWNTTIDAPLLFIPTNVALQGNSTSLPDTESWTFTSASNITAISFSSNQSVYLHHNLTLWYRRDVSAQASWNVDTSGDDVTWNLTSPITYPMVSQQRYLNLSVYPDWITTGLYNGSSPTNHTSFSKSGTEIHAWDMTNGTWTLTNTAPNYVTGIVSPDLVSITDNMPITNTIQDPSLINATTGSTNLTIWQGSLVVAGPPNETVVNGATSYLWDIYPDTSNNGTYRIEVYWTNGTEAGYLAKEFVIYYPTTLKPLESSITAFTNSSFDISVYFNETFTPKPIDGGYAGVTVVYSFDGGTWNSLTDHANGTWTTTINTAGYSAGFYQLRVNGSGLAIENQSITINVELIYDTQPLTVGWSPPNLNNISYLESTNLTVQYRFANGTPVADALITVTDYITTWTMHYSPSGGIYWLQFNGTDAPGIGTHPLNISATKTGYESQFNASQSLTIHPEPTSITVTWSPNNVTIPYSESLTLRVDYTYGGGDVPPTALVNVTINSKTYPLSWNGTAWNVTIPGSDIGLGVYSAQISAWAYGYIAQTNVTSGINVTIAPNSFIVIWENPSDLNATFAELVNITVIYTYDSNPVPNATVRLYLNTTTVYEFTLSSIDDRWHLLLNASDIGLGDWNATIVANSTGYDSGHQEDVLQVVVDPCTATPNEAVMTVYYTHSEDLSITLLDSVGNPVIDALVNATYRGSSYNLTHVGNGVYRLIINGSDGLGHYNVQVWTYRYGLINHTLSISVDIVKTPTTGTLDTIIGGYNSTVLFLDGWVIFRLTLQDVDSNLLAGAEVNLTTSTTVYILTDNGDGTYELNLTGWEIGITTFSGEVSASIAGYEPWNTTLSVVVEPIPTRLDVVVGRIPSEMYLNETLSITLEYVNIHTNETIDPDGQTFTWAGVALSYSKPSPGRFTFTLSAIGLDLTTHVLYISMNRANYSTQIIDVDIVVRAVHTSLSTEVQYRDYENETIIIEVVYRDIDRDLNVIQGTVNMTLEGVVYPLVYNATTNSYYLVFRIPLPAGTYTLTFTASAKGYETAQTTATLIVDEKGQPVMTLEVVGSVIIGAPLVARATLTQDGQPLVGYTVIFEITIMHIGGTNTTTTLTKLTDNEGVAEISYVIPSDISDATDVFVAARFSGDRLHWSVLATTTRPITTPGLVQQLLSYFTNPLGILQLIIVIAIVVGAYKWRSKRRTEDEAFKSRIAHQYDYFTAIAGLQHLMVIYKNRGTCLFYHPFSEEQIKADLISGFISAITSMHTEMDENGEQGVFEELNYSGLRVNSREGNYVMAILIGRKTMPTPLRDALQKFVDKFEKHYAQDLKGWSGLMDGFDQEWIISTLYDTLHYHIVLPHTLAADADRRAKGVEKKVVKIIQQILREGTTPSKEFCIADSIAQIAKKIHRSEAEVLDILTKMEQRRLIVPIPLSRLMQSSIYVSETPVTDTGETGDSSVEEESLDEDTAAPDGEPSHTEDTTEPTESDSIESFIMEVEKLLTEKSKTSSETEVDEDSDETKSPSDSEEVS